MKILSVFLGFLGLLGIFITFFSHQAKKVSMGVEALMTAASNHLYFTACMTAVVLVIILGICFSAKKNAM